MVPSPSMSAIQLLMDFLYYQVLKRLNGNPYTQIVCKQFLQIIEPSMECITVNLFLQNIKPSMERIMVFERSTGKFVTGPMAPTESSLQPFLEKYPTFEVVRPGNSSGSYSSKYHYTNTMKINTSSISARKRILVQNRPKEQCKINEIIRSHMNMGTICFYKVWSRRRRRPR